MSLMTPFFSVLLFFFDVPISSGLVVEYRTCRFQVAVSVSPQLFASNLEQVDNLLCTQVNLASYLQWDEK